LPHLPGANSRRPRASATYILGLGLQLGAGAIARQNRIIADQQAQAERTMPMAVAPPLATWHFQIRVSNQVWLPPDHKTFEWEVEQLPFPLTDSNEPMTRGSSTLPNMTPTSAQNGCQSGKVGRTGPSHLPSPGGPGLRVSTLLGYGKIRRLVLSGCRMRGYRLRRWRGERGTSYGWLLGSQTCY